MGVTSEPLPLLYTRSGRHLSLVYSYTPFVILAIYSALQRLDPSYAEASRDLGAGAATTFFRITLPLTASGVAAGAVFVFVLSIAISSRPICLAAASSRWSATSSTISFFRPATGPSAPRCRRSSLR